VQRRYLLRHASFLALQKTIYDTPKVFGAAPHQGVPAGVDQEHPAVRNLARHGAQLRPHVRQRFVAQAGGK
jgi:hypothetical protein